MKLSNLILGRPLETSAENEHRIGVAAGIPISGLEGLTGATYGPEQTMLLLIPLGLLGMQHYLLPILSAILTLLVILYFSYRQTITTYPIAMMLAIRRHYKSVAEEVDDPTPLHTASLELSTGSEGRCSEGVVLARF